MLPLTNKYNNYKKNDMNWDMCPSSLYWVMKEIWDRYHKYMMITENGCCDNSIDKTRAINFMKYTMYNIICDVYTYHIYVHIICVI